MDKLKLKYKKTIMEYFPLTLNTFIKNSFLLKKENIILVLNSLGVKPKVCEEKLKDLETPFTLFSV